mmetsp:Transcript_45200/g.107588  ORF Transcript_45200/g.107588 Transcript_45200/m.107588 type:complete len:188 (+) Transcript_45200:75-638(+)
MGCRSSRTAEASSASKVGRKTLPDVPRLNALDERLDLKRVQTEAFEKKEAGYLRAQTCAKDAAELSAALRCGLEGRSPKQKKALKADLHHTQLRGTAKTTDYQYNSMTSSPIKLCPGDQGRVIPPDFVSMAEHMEQLDTLLARIERDPRSLLRAVCFARAAMGQDQIQTAPTQVAGAAESSAWKIKL